MCNVWFTHFVVVGVGGQEPEADYPYTGENGNCNFHKKDVVASISGYQTVRNLQHIASRTL